MTEHELRLASPLGRLTLVASERGLRQVRMTHDRDAAAPALELPAVRVAAGSPILVAAARQLAEYFAGTRTAFDLPIDAVGTPFQQAVWAALRTIPHGATRSYADVARLLGRPSATRAVGAANARNPVAIVTPCHRVIGSDGALTGFAGGLENKRRLLALERRAISPTLF